jgi:hypothetical protein
VLQPLDDSVKALQAQLAASKKEAQAAKDQLVRPIAARSLLCVIPCIMAVR